MKEENIGGCGGWRVGLGRASSVAVFFQKYIHACKWYLGMCVAVNASLTVKVLLAEEGGIKFLW